MRLSRILMIGTALICSGLSLCIGTSLAAQENGGLAGQLRQKIGVLGDYGFSGTVLVAADGKILLHAGYGKARRSPSRGMKPETAFPVASISKQFTAAGVLKLEEAGRLKTSDPISRHLKGVPEEKAGMTVLQLLSHTSGLPFECGRRPASMEALQECLWAEPLGEPGQVQYSNAGYALLAAIVEQASGQPFRGYMREHLFQAAGMSKTGFIDEPQRFPEQQSAYQYTWEVEHGSEIGTDLNWNLRGSADVVTTAGDLFRWDQALRSGAVLKADSLRRLLMGDGRTDVPLISGYGWNATQGGQVQMAEGTFALGFNAAFRRYAANKAAAVVLSNQNYGLLMSTPLVLQVIENALLGSKAPDLPAAVAASQDWLSRCAGTYHLEGQGQFEVRPDSGALVISASGQPAVSLLAGQSRTESQVLQSRSGCPEAGPGAARTALL